jgi:hypothetical protein
VKKLIQKTGATQDDIEAMLAGVKASIKTKSGKEVTPADVSKLATEDGKYVIDGYETIKVVKRAKDSGSSLMGIQPAVNSLDNVSLPYSRGRNMLDSMQDDAFDREVAGSRFLKKAITTNTQGAGLGVVADQKAAMAGSNVGDVNKQISKVLDTYKTAADAITPNNIRRAFFGSQEGNPAYANARQSLAQVDEVLGTDLSSDVGMKSMQAWAENTYLNPKSFGSGRVAGGMLEGGAKGALTGAGGGAAIGSMIPVIGTGVGAGVGATVGAVRGAMQAARLANPEQAMKSLSGMIEGQQAAEAALDKLSSGRTIREMVSMPKQTVEALRTFPLREALQGQAPRLVNPQTMEPVKKDEDIEDWSQ